MPITDSFDRRDRMIKFCSTVDEAWQFANSIDTTKYKIIDYGKMDNIKCHPYYILFEKKR